MRTTCIRRFTVTTTMLIAGLGGSLAPALADEAPATCDPVALSAAVDAATTQARAAQKAYTTYAHGAMRTQIAQLKAKETREAREAAKAAKKAEAKAKAAHEQVRGTPPDDAATQAAKAARAQARAAAAKARIEAREAAKVRHANKEQLLALVKTERARLKAVWTEAKKALAETRSAAEACDSAVGDETPEA
jgi:hypothetical protein